MNFAALSLVALFVLGFGAVSGRLPRSPITPPMVFAAFGLLIGSERLGLIDVDVASERECGCSPS